MTTRISKEERKRLYFKVRTALGAGMSGVEIEDERLDALLEMAIEDLSAYLNDWIVEQQWSSLSNIDVSKESIINALTTKDIDWERSFTLAYSKQVGLGTNAPSEWELKRDYVEVSGNTQTYVIPAGREVNEVLWFTPPDIELTHGNPFNMGNWGMGVNGWNYGGKAAMAMQPSYTILLNQTDVSMKNKILRSELTYRITAGPNGTKILYLYPVPGSNLEISGFKGRHFEGAKVWYFYYDNVIDRDKCLELNEEIVKLPSDVPIDNINYDKFNASFKTKVRRILIASAKKYLGAVRGKFSGEIKADDASLTLDYGFLLSEGNEEYQKVFEELKEYLESMSYVNMMEKRNSISENLNSFLGRVPFDTPISVK